MRCAWGTACADLGWIGPVWRAGTCLERRGAAVTRDARNGNATRNNWSRRGGKTEARARPGTTHSPDGAAGGAAGLPSCQGTTRTSVIAAWRNHVGPVESRNNASLAPTVTVPAIEPSFTTGATRALDRGASSSPWAPGSAASLGIDEHRAVLEVAARGWSRPAGSARRRTTRRRPACRGRTRASRFPVAWLQDHW